MNLDPRRHEDPASDVRNAEVYAVLRRMRRDLSCDLDAVLPVEAAIAATLGSESDLQPARPPRVSPLRPVRQWLLGVWIAIAQMVCTAADRLLRTRALVLRSQIDSPSPAYWNPEWGGSPLARVEAEVAGLISIAEDVGAKRLPQRSAAETVFLLQELREGLQERALSKERARTLMAHAHQQLDELLETVGRVKVPVRLLLSLLPLPVFVSVLASASVTSSPGAMAAGGIVASIFALSLKLLTALLGKLDHTTLTQRGRIRTAFTRLSEDVERLFDDSDDHSGSTLRS